MSSVRLKHRKKVCTHLHGLVFFFLNTLTQAKGGRLWEEEEARGSTDKTLEGSRGLTSGEEEEEVHNGEQRICKNSFCILFFFFPNSCELRILRFFR